jgi:hypothetical protein
MPATEEFPTDRRALERKSQSLLRLLTKGKFDSVVPYFSGHDRCGEREFASLLRSDTPELLWPTWLEPVRTLGEQAFRVANSGVLESQLLRSHRPFTLTASSDPTYYCLRILVA